MIRHVLKIIWAERKVNLWILLELIIVFCTLWFCVDYLFFMAKRYFEPKGFSVEHVYQINIGQKNDVAAETGDQEKKTESEIDIWTILDRIKSYRDVENACISFASMPYSDSYSGGSVFFDTVTSSTRIKFVTPEYFDVFNIDMIKGKAFTWNEITGENMAVISSNRDNKLLNMPIENVQTFYGGRIGDTPLPENTFKVAGVAAKTKWSEYHDYEAVVYYPLRKDDQRNGNWEISVRLKTEADHDFIPRFTKDMSDQLEVGEYYLSSIESLQAKKESFVKRYQFEANMNSMYSILIFVIINIFLAIIGTFWFRTRARRNEIGIRLAHGASKSNIKLMFTSETLLLLFISSIIGFIICINISMVDILHEIDLPVANRDNPASIADYSINYIISITLLILITLLAVWYPAAKASKTQPAETLKSE